MTRCTACGFRGEPDDHQPGDQECTDLQNERAYKRAGDW